MKWLRSILNEIFGLFVDSGSLALMVLAWIGATTLLFTKLGWLPLWRGPILFCGLAIILLTSALHYARNKPR